jgi:PAS domain S-box-containing protein
LPEEQDALSRISDSARLQLLIDAVADYAIYLLDARGHVATWNSSAQRIKGYAGAEIIGRHFSTFYTPEDVKAGMPAHGLESARRTGHYAAEGWRQRKDGSRFWASVVISAVRDDSGNLIGFAKITRDATERRNAQIALQNAREQLAQAQKMEALGQFTGGVAHDFNNLLMVVLGNARIVKALVGGNERGQRAVEAIEHAATRGEALTRQLLTFARHQHLAPERVRLDAWMEKFSAAVAGSLGDKVRLVNEIGPETTAIEIDPNEFERAVLNLVVNARDAMPEGGAITLSARDADTRRGTHPQHDLEGRFVAFSVSDTGMGIPEDVLPNVFDPFFTTKPSGKGTGLGLSQVHGFAMQSGGAVTVDSKPGAGTTVTLLLPCAEGAVARESQPPLRSERQADHIVLLVEDNVDVAAANAEMLMQLGYRVVHARSAEAALQTAAEAPADLVVSDIALIGAMDGLALADAVRRRWPHLPVLLITAYGRIADTAARRYPILRKPFDIGALRAAVAKLTDAPGSDRAPPSDAA